MQGKEVRGGLQQSNCMAKSSESTSSQQPLTESLQPWAGLYCQGLHSSGTNAPGREKWRHREGFQAARTGPSTSMSALLTRQQL